MPGLIDAHVHVYGASINLGRVTQAPSTYLAHFAARFLQASLQRGFTTLRDVGGGDVGIALAIKDGLLDRVPRFFYGGPAISQTGGHGDFRGGDLNFYDNDYCACVCHAGPIAILADGPDAIRRAVREQFRRGASHIKIMASGGALSPTDPLERDQYSREEISVAVDEARRAGSYVAAHCHPSQAIRRAVELGVRSIEHGTLIDEETAKFVADSDAIVVPTMAIIFALLEEGEKLGLPPASMDKIRRASEHALSGLEIMKRANVRMGFGTDLLGQLHDRQSSEFTLRNKVLAPIDILRSACSTNADLIGQRNVLGCVREGAAADLLLVDGNPLENISLLTVPERLVVVMKEGEFYKRLV
jgi:imidazolonepropionase-like amidohydrolase